METREHAVLQFRHYDKNLASDMSGLRQLNIFVLLGKTSEQFCHHSFYTNNIVSMEVIPNFSEVETMQFIILCVHVYAHESVSVLDQTVIFNYLLYVFIITSSSREAPVYGASMHTRAQAHT